MIHPYESFSIFDSPELCPEELRGSLSREERALLPPKEPPHDLAIDGAISALLLGSAYAPMDFLEILHPDAGGPPVGERENGYTELRLTTGYALQIPTPANYEAIGRAVVKVARMAMRNRALAALDEIDATNNEEQ